MAGGIASARSRIPNVSRSAVLSTGRCGPVRVRDHTAVPAPRTSRGHSSFTCASHPATTAWHHSRTPSVSGSPVRTPLVTVILPAKDAGEYIGTTLETLTRQFDDAAAVKLVAIDDGSRDDTGALMQQYAQAVPARHRAAESDGTRAGDGPQPGACARRGAMPSASSTVTTGCSRDGSRCWVSVARARVRLRAHRSRHGYRRRAGGSSAHRTRGATG